MIAPEAHPLYGGVLAPITDQIGYIRAPLPEVVEALRNWRADLHGSAGVTELPGTLLENAHHLEPLTVGVHPRELLVGTRAGEWVAYFDCGHLGSDPAPPVSVLAKRLGTDAVAIAWAPPSAEVLGGVQFQLFGPVPLPILNNVRAVSAIEEDHGRWIFVTSGTEQAFEEPEVYRSRRVRERFTPEMLQRYARAMGIDPFGDDYYSGPCALITTPVEKYMTRPTVTLAEVRRRLRLDGE